MTPETLLLKGSEVDALLGIDECMTAVEHAFKMRALGEAAALPVKSFIKNFSEEFVHHIDHKRCLVTEPAYA